MRNTHYYSQQKVHVVDFTKILKEKSIIPQMRIDVNLDHIRFFTNSVRVQNSPFKNRKGWNADGEDQKRKSFTRALTVESVNSVEWVPSCRPIIVALFFTRRP